MTFYKTTAAFGATACLLMASGAFADATYDGTFDGETGAGTWTGGTIEAAAVAAPTPAGLPISSAAVTENKVYSIAGSATNTYAGMANAPFADMMVKVSIPDEALAALAITEGGEAYGAKFAVAVDTTTVNNETKGIFKYFSGATLENPSGWTELSSDTYAADEWVRVTMKFDYTNKKCTVALNGNTCGTYDLLDNNASALASIEVKGSTAIDEVVVAQGSLPAFADQTAVVVDGCLATKAWLTKNDVTWPDSLTSDQKNILSSQYVFGVSPDVSATTAATLPLSFEQDDDDDKATLSFPGFGAYGGTGTYVLQSSATGAANSFSDVVPAATITSGAAGSKTTVSLPSTPGQAVYYRIKAQAAQSGS